MHEIVPALELQEHRIRTGQLSHLRPLFARRDFVAGLISIADWGADSGPAAQRGNHRVAV
jgi:hypothetical protein